MNYATSKKYKDVEDYIVKHGDVKVSDLTANFFISEATVRRILTALEKKGLIRRYHGGASLVDPESLSSVKRRRISCMEEKEAIGELAASFVADGSTILLMGGSTVEMMCQYIRHMRLTVITNSLPVVNALAWNTNIQLIIMGGVLNSTEMEMRGQLTEHGMSRLRADSAFMGTSGLHPTHGAMTDDPNSIGTYMRCANVSDKVFILADSTKFTHLSGTSTLYGLNEITDIITDSRVPAGALAQYRAMGIHLHIAEIETPEIESIV